MAEPARLHSGATEPCAIPNRALLSVRRRGSLAQFRLSPVVAVPVPQTAERQRNPVNKPLQLIQGSLSANRIDRQSPWLAILHRISDGTLAGLGLAVLGLSALTLHWQGQWTRNFEQLESDQRLEHRLQESTSLLEQHHLAMTHKANLLQPTSSEKLIYVSPPPQTRSSVNLSSLLAKVNLLRITAGY